jgi:dTDP-4-amino-4,6-dideoxygalactose transaminase
MNELTAAVGLAQLDKVVDICERRNAYGKKLTEGISGIKGLYPHKVIDGCDSSYWFYMLRINEEEFGASRAEFVKALVAEGIPACEGYIPSCVYQYDMFKNRTVYCKDTTYPLDGTHGNPIEYNDGDCPIAEEVLKTCVKLEVNEFFTEDDLNETIKAINKIAAYFAK